MEKIEIKLTFDSERMEAWNLLRKMDEYCRQQTGQSLKDYRASL